MSTFGYATPAFAAASLAALNLIGIIVFLPESLSARQNWPNKSGGR